MTNKPVRITDQLRLRPVTCVNTASRELLIEKLHDSGFRMIQLDGRLVRDKESFLLQAGNDLPQPVDMIAYDNWDAFNDNIRWEIRQMPDDQIAIIWNDAQEILNGGLPTLLVAIDIFTGIIREIRRPNDGTVGKRLRIFLVGSGPNFSEEV